MKKKKFENPALQFEGTWQVTSYDFRGFEEVPNNIIEQFSEEWGAFPIGQRIQFVHTGRSVMPGTFNTTTLEFPGPVKETLTITLLPPFEKELCQGRWDFVCARPNENFSTGMMIGEIFDWKKEIPARYAEVWADVKPLQYGLGQLNKNASFNVWFAKNGDMVIPLVIDGRKKGGGDAAKMGVWLKRIKD